MQILKDNVKEDIINSAISHFTTYGYKETSMANIAKGATVSVGNVYRYFKNKESLIEHILTPVAEELNDFLGHISVQTVQNGNLEVLNHLIDQFLMMCDRYKARFSLLMNENNGQIAATFKENLARTLVNHFNNCLPPSPEVLESSLVVRTALANSWITGFSYIIRVYYAQPEVLKRTLNSYALLILDGLRDLLSPIH